MATPFPHPLPQSHSDFRLADSPIGSFPATPFACYAQGKQRVLSMQLTGANCSSLPAYAVDGNSLRVIKVWSGERTWYLYAGTQLISEYEDAATQSYNPGTNAGSAGSDSYATILYQHADHLTTRLTTENDGDLSNEQRHYPYGESLQEAGTANASVERKFTTYMKEWETESTGGKLNYAVFREQSARTGRFLMVDPLRGNVRNPQRLNRYAYVTNNPTNLIDPRGLDEGPWDPSQCTDNPTHPKCPPRLMEDGPGSDSPILFGGTYLGSWLIGMSVGYEELYGSGLGGLGFLGGIPGDQEACARQAFEYGMNRYGLWSYVVGELS
jgi:RHS repeat-associated protein